MGSVFFCGFFQFVMMLAGFYLLDFALNSLILFHNMQSKIGRVLVSMMILGFGFGGKFVFSL